MESYQSLAMLLAVDVYYDKQAAFVAGVSFNDWSDSQPVDILRTKTEVSSGYQPGEFYRRELPCILTFLASHQLKPHSIIIDGFVFLGDAKRPGLGKHLYDSLGGLVKVVGVAKSPFRDTPAKYEVRRGGSLRPLYVTSAGMPLETAKERVIKMHGQHRMPTLLGIVDAATKAT